MAGVNFFGFWPLVNEGEISPCFSKTFTFCNLSKPAKSRFNILYRFLYLELIIMLLLYEHFCSLACVEDYSTMCIAAYLHIAPLITHWSEPVYCMYLHTAN